MQKCGLEPATDVNAWTTDSGLTTMETIRKKKATWFRRNFEWLRYQ